MKIFVRNLPFNANEKQIRQFFAGAGEIKDCYIFTDKDTGKSQGKAKITFATEDQARKAIETLNGQTFQSRPLMVQKDIGSSDKRVASAAQHPRQAHPSHLRPVALATTREDREERFYNPYTFAPTPPRQNIPANNFAADTDPIKAGLVHDCLVDNLWSGTMDIKAKIITPLVLPAPKPEEDPDTHHKTFTCKTGPEPSELRGMLRSAYECVTNSRFHGFGKDQHKDRLGLRMTTNDAKGLVPARMLQNASGWQINLMTGKSTISSKKLSIMYAAWLPRYEKYTKSTKTCDLDKNEQLSALPLSGFPSPATKPYPSDFLPQHRQRVFFQHRTVTHGNGNQAFEYLLVTDIQDAPVSVPLKKGWTEGWVCITGRNMVNKHYERVFFRDGTPLSQPLGLSIVQSYELLIRNYQELHKDERSPKDTSWPDRMNGYIGHEPGKTGWSRHVWNEQDIRLKDGDLVYAKVNVSGAGSSSTMTVTAIYPVMISRDLYTLAPLDLLPESLYHPQDLDSLSPADRLFGWVARGKETTAEAAAYRGRIRVEVAPTSLQYKAFPNPLPLAILGEPKPAQGRFYVAKDKQGRAQDSGGTKMQRGYQTKEQGLRGRKLYWQHKGLEQEQAPENYWNPFNDNVLQGDNTTRSREYIRAGKNLTDLRDRQDGQNRSIRQWIEPGQSFTFRLHLHNASKEELGALLWLLSLPADHHFRLGYGKPLGLGSLLLSLGSVQVAKGETWRSKYYNSLFNTIPPNDLNEQIQDELKNSFKNAMVKAYPKSNQQERQEATASFQTLPFVAGFLRAAQGPQQDYPIHYPRRSPRSEPNGENFKWFVHNEDGCKENGVKFYGQKLVLPYVLNENGWLPLNPTKA